LKNNQKFQIKNPSILSRPVNYPTYFVFPVVVGDAPCLVVNDANATSTTSCIIFTTKPDFQWSQFLSSRIGETFKDYVKVRYPSMNDLEGEVVVLKDEQRVGMKKVLLNVYQKMSQFGMTPHSIEDSSE